MKWHVGENAALDVCNVDLDDPEQMRELEAKLLQRCEEKLQMKLRRVRTLGIICDYGNRLSQTLPPDMREGCIGTWRRLNARAPIVYRCAADRRVLFRNPEIRLRLVNQEFEQVRPTSHRVGSRATIVPDLCRRH